MEQKTCIRCGVKRSLENFSKHGDSGNYRNVCRECQNATNRKRYLDIHGQHKRDAKKELRESDPKICIRCNKEKPLSAFNYHNRAKGQHRNLCVECQAAWAKNYNASPEGQKTSKEYVARNKARYDELKEFYKNDPKRKAARKVYHRKRQLAEYGLTLKDYERMLKSQDGKCAICGTTDTGKKDYFRIDHCHKTGKVRGLLCHSCNVSLGLFKDSRELLQKAYNYLTQPQPKVTKSK